MYPISNQQISEWSSAYPGVDVKTELLRMKVWLDANPTKKKTSRGILKFIVGWLTKAQDSGRGFAGTSLVPLSMPKIKSRVELSNEHQQAERARVLQGVSA
jgi:hypothetical protein